MNLNLNALLSLVLLQVPASDHHAVRRPLAPILQVDGWARLELDAEAHQQRASLWLSDQQGVPIPFVSESSQTWASRDLALKNPLYGQDPSGQPTVEFRPEMPEGWTIGEREGLTIDLDVIASPTYVANVIVARRQAGGEWLTLNQPLHIYSLEPQRSHTRVKIPWDALEYRISLAATQGQIEKIAGIRVATELTLARPIADESVDLSVVQLSSEPNRWQLKSARADRFDAMDLEVAPPVAPVSGEVTIAVASSTSDKLVPRSLGVSGLLWNLPALSSRATRLNFEAVVIDAFELTVPAGVTITQARAHRIPERLLFPAQAGVTYYLHQGSQPQFAPGSLQALPSRGALRTVPWLQAGAAQEDPQAIVEEASWTQGLRSWLVWLVAGIVMALSAVAWRLMRSSNDASPPPVA